VFSKKIKILSEILSSSIMKLHKPPLAVVTSDIFVKLSYAIKSETQAQAACVCLHLLNAGIDSKLMTVGSYVFIVR